MGRALEQCAAGRRDASEFALAICDPSFLTDADLAGFAPWSCVMNECDWESIQDDIRAGKVLAWPCESGQQDAVRTALLYELGFFGIEFCWQPAKARILVRRTIRPEPAEPGECDTASPPAGSADPIGDMIETLRAECNAVLATLSSESLQRVLPVLQRVAKIAADVPQEWDRAGLLERAADAVARLHFLELTTARNTLRKWSNDTDSADDGDE